MLVRRASANIEGVGDKSGEESDTADVAGIATNWGAEGAAASMV